MGTVIALLTLGQACIVVVRLYFGYEGSCGIIPLFQLNPEANIPTWFQSANLLMCSLFAGSIAAGEWRKQSPLRAGWAVTAFFLMAFSLDETAQLHDGLSHFSKRFQFQSNLLRYPWVIAGSVFVVFFAAYLLPMVMKLSAVIRRRLALGFAAYFGSALGLEFVESMIASRIGTHNLIFLLVTSVEEVGEMLSILFLSCAFLAHLRDTEKEAVIEFGSNP